MSKLNFKDPAESLLVNGKFVGRDVDDSMIGKIDLANPEASSGDSITNMQRQINENKSKLMPNQIVTALGNLVSDRISKVQIKRIEGDSASVVVSSTIFGSTPDIQDGTIFYLIGQSDANTVTIEHSDIDDGCILNGDAQLKLGYCLQLLWDSSTKRFIDIGRNF